MSSVKTACLCCAQ